MYAPIVLALLVTLPSPELLVALGYLITLKTASLPDIDMYLVRLQAKIPNFIKGRLPYTISHRGITHTVYFSLFVGIGIAVFLFVMFYYISVVVGSINLPGFTAGFEGIILLSAYAGFVGVYGIVSHFVGDVITPTGLKPFYPIDNRRYRRTFSILGQESKAKNQFWNKGFLAFGVGLNVVIWVVAFEEAREPLIQLALQIL